MTNVELYDVVIIGAGPGGLSAALYASRSNLSTLLLEQSAPGGELLNTSDVENYVGFDLIPGPELAAKMHQSATRFGVEQAYGEVLSIQPGSERHRVILKDREYHAKGVILATGAYHRKLGVPGEEDLAGRGVSYCAVCDGFFFKDQEVVVVGGGDSAVEEGIFLTQFAKKVTIIHRRDELRAQKILQDRAFANDKIEFIWDTVVDSINGDEVTESVTIRNVKTGETSDLPTQGAFVYIGILPNSALVKDLGVTDEDGWILTDESMSTKVPGIYAVGDVRDTHLRQIATAVGDGAHAGQAVFDYIQSLPQDIDVTQ